VLKNGGLWRDIYGIDEKRVASLVREDKVDILVELTGHTANNKLGTMACRPAPIQVLWCLMMHTHCLISELYCYILQIQMSISAQLTCYQMIVYFLSCLVL
jgi:predicted O-linked N-acetylglucosamine transferase (SPINDLY family)